MRRKADTDHLGFWADLARKSVYWHKPFTVTLDDSRAPNYRWFPDGELNVSWNCLDIHLEARGDKTAIIFEGEAGDVRRLSYRELHAEVCRLANALRHLGIGRGDRVVIYMPMVPEAVIAMQACARIGAVHSVVFGGFSFNSHARSHRGRRRTRGHHRRRRAAWRRPHRAQVGGRQGAVRRLSDHRESHRAQALRRPGAACGPGATCGGTSSPQGSPPTARRVGRCRASAVPALYLRIHRPAQGHPAFQRRLPVERQSSPPSGCSTCARTTSSGAPPTSAGSPATATSPTDRWRPARPWSCTKARRLVPDGGRFWKICQTTA